MSLRNGRRQMLGLVILLCLVTACALPSLAEPPAAPPQKDNAVAVLFTSDVHCYYDRDIGYDGLMLYKEELAQRYADVLLVDAGDAIQGAPLGAISGGEEPIRLMNAVGYDVATLGNHEFDYGFDVLDRLQEALSCGYIWANFCTADGVPVYAPYKIIESGGMRIAFIGADTPDTFSKTVIHDITDDTGVPMYDFKADASGEALYACLQGCIDEVRGQGADFAILIAHLGNGNDATEAFRSPEVIAHLTGLSAVIDAHSHQVCNTTAPDADGVQVPLVQTGSYFKNVGLMLLEPDGTISVDLVSEIPAPEAWMEGMDAVEVTRGDRSRWVDADTHRLMEVIAESYAPVMNRKVGALDDDLIVRDDSGADISRNHENGLCELVADAYRAISGADVSVINAGSVRNNLMAGEVTFNDVLNVLPYSNDILIARLSGQILLDMLEFGCRSMPAISPGFPQVSGLAFTVDIGTESSVETDENGDFVGVAGAYRVRDVTVGGLPLNPERQYTIATTSFLLGGGDHFKMLADHAEIIGTTQMADNILLAEYIEVNLNGQIPSDYRQGGRIREIQTSE
ncbi:MAG: bifunctional metallophosphatase/5'-nucleotidase [Clostridia bacterium]|nr:bifunctional metallophosphatase/5'-nucleotidase [Clostridia bacterium]